MPNLGTATMDGVTAPAQPTDEITIVNGSSNIQTSTTHDVSAPNSLEYLPTTDGSEGKAIITGAVNTNPNAISAEDYVIFGPLGTGGGGHAQAFKLLFADDPGYVIGGASGEYIGPQLYRDNFALNSDRIAIYASAGMGGNVVLDDAAVGTLWPDNVPIRVWRSLETDTLKIKIQRMDDNNYLAVSGGVASWGATEVFAYDDDPGVGLPSVDRVQRMYSNDHTGTSSPGSLYTDNWSDDDLTAEDPLAGGTISQGTIGSIQAVLNEATAPSGGTAPYSYQWQIDDGGGYDDVSGATNGATVTITGLTPGTEYTVRRRVTDDVAAVEYSDEEVFTTVAALSPGVITDVATGATVQQLGSSSGASLGGGGYTYQWQRKLGAGAYANVSGATATTLTNSGLTPGASYTFKRIATDSEGTSADSNEIAVTMGAALAGGTITEGTVAYNSVDINSGGGATGGAGSMSYQLQRRVSGVGSFADLSGLTGVDPAADTTVSASTDYDYRRKVTDGESTIAYSNELTVNVPAAPGGTFTADLSTVPANHAGAFDIVLTGTGTTWDGTTVFSETGAGGLVIDSYNVASTTSATLTCHTTSALGTSTIDDGTVNTADVEVATATLTLSPTSIDVDASESITATGVNTLWTQEVAATLFTGSGSGIVSNINVVSDMSATFDFTDAVAETVTIDDASTGATDDITVNEVATSVMKLYADSVAVTGTPVFTLQNTAGEFWNGTAFETYTGANVATYAIAATNIVGTGYHGTYPTLSDGLYFLTLLDRQGGALAAGDFAIPYVLDRTAVTIKNGNEQGWGTTGLSSAQDTKLTNINTKTAALPSDPADASVVAALIAAVQSAVDEVVAQLQNADIDIDTGGLTGTVRIYTAGTAQTAGNLIRTIPIQRASTSDPFSFRRVT